MKSLNLLLVLSGLMAAASLAAATDDLKIVANKNIGADSISAAELKSVFLEESIRFAGTSVEPVLEDKGAVHETFLKEYLGKDANNLETYYRTLVFNGRGSMPKTLHSDAEVLAYVAKTNGAIGYVSAAIKADNVKTLVVT